ncbi:MNIO family bufferin maturase [Kaarinaea lacus]
MLNPSIKEVLGPRPIPARAGIGLRAEHYQDVLEKRPDIGWFEVHSENYFGKGGRPLHYLDKISEHYPLSLHGVGLSIGSTDELNTLHLDKLKQLIRRFEPGLVSEHLSWGSFNGRYFNDLFPIPYTSEALQHMINRVIRVQDYLGRQILIENVSSYLQFDCSTIPEWEFIAELANQSGCGILLDINNIYVNSKNHAFDPEIFIDTIPIEHVQEIHLAGHTVKQFADSEILIDTHNKRVTSEVWLLYESAARRFNQVPVLIEWDSDIPALDILLDEADKADRILQLNYRDKKHEYIA